MNKIGFIGTANANIAANTESAGCNSDTIGASSGTTTLEAQWQANQINISWYNGDSEITPSNNAAGKCTYDQAMVLPSNTLSKEGYTFDGWTVKAAAAPTPAQCSLANLDTKINATNTNEMPYENIPESGPVGEWEAVFSYGTIKGIAMMSSVNSTEKKGYCEPGDIGDPYSGNTSSSSYYCWCKATQFTPTNGSTCNLPNDMPWIYADDLDDLGLNAYYCPQFCLGAFRYSEAARINLFGQSN